MIEAALSRLTRCPPIVSWGRVKNTPATPVCWHVVSNDARRPAIEDLRAHLRTVLPRLHVPSAFAFLDAHRLRQMARWTDRKSGYSRSRIPIALVTGLFLSRLACVSDCHPKISGHSGRVVS